jgi:hypothetical protein
MSPVVSLRIEAKWSNTQQWSKPASSAIRQTARSSIVVNYGASFSPTRTLVTRRTLAVAACQARFRSEGLG